MKRLSQTTIALLAMALVTASPAQEMTLVVDPAKTTVSFTLEATMHKVHGTFRVKSGVIRFNPATGAASGSVVVDATSGGTGNSKRDRNMHGTVLESERYPEIAFTPVRVKGSFSAQGESSVTLEGVLRLHGAEHAVALPCKVQTSEGALRATTQFTIPYVAWGMKNPSSFLLHVGDSVEISISAEGKLAGNGD